jgi:hypothetical protein
MQEGQANTSVSSIMCAVIVTDVGTVHWTVPIHDDPRTDTAIFWTCGFLNYSTTYDHVYKLS